MKPTIVYVYPRGGDGGYFEKAFRFLNSYNSHPPGIEHNSIVVCNGGTANSAVRILFSSLPNLTLLEHDNSGYDIGAFQRASRDIGGEFMMFFGVGAYVRIPGWLSRMCEAFARHGDNLYGSMGSLGAPGVSPHIRTTGFAITPSLFNQYPVRVTTPDQRYPFEHGPNCLTTWVAQMGRAVWIVGVTGEWSMNLANQIPNGFHNGDQSNLLTGDRLSEPPFFPFP